MNTKEDLNKLENIKQEFINMLNVNLKGSTYKELDVFIKTLKYDNNYIKKILNILVNEKKVIIKECNNRKIIALEELYRLEKEIIDFVIEIKEKENRIDNKNLNKYINKVDYINLNKEQKDAVFNALSESITIIKGKAGTGKTTIVKAILSIYRSINNKGIVDIVSFTGKAVNRIALEDIKGAQTIHKFLELSIK